MRRDALGHGAAAKSFSVDIQRRPRRGTWQAAAHSNSNEPGMTISAFSRPGALVDPLGAKESEQTSSANWSVSWAGVMLRGPHFPKVYFHPRRAAPQAASQPASPPPTTVILLFCTRIPCWNIRWTHPVLPPLITRSSPHSKHRCPVGRFHMVKWHSG